MLAIRVSVPPESENRALEIVVDSLDFYRSSRVQLDGDRGPRINELKIDGVPAGTYQITATVIGADGKRGEMVRASVQVMEAA